MRWVTEYEADLIKRRQFFADLAVIFSFIAIVGALVLWLWFMNLGGDLRCLESSQAQLTTRVDNLENRDAELKNEIAQVRQSAGNFAESKNREAWDAKREAREALNNAQAALELAEKISKGEPVGFNHNWKAPGQ